MDSPFALPSLTGAAGEDGWVEERLRYRIRARPKPKFHTVLDAQRLFGKDGGDVLVVTRTRPPESGERVLDLSITVDIAGVHMEDRLECVWRAGVRASRLLRVVGKARRKEIDFINSPFALPVATYPEVLVPFLLRSQPRDGKRRALYAWTSDRFVARVYYESRRGKKLTVPAGRIATTEVWMYPDLNDWVKMGSMLTRLAKPFLPRYEFHYEDAAPHRLVRFEGPYGPPGAPEVIVELLGSAPDGE